MTEKEWLASVEAYAMIRDLPKPVSGRRCLLAVCGYVRRIEQYIPHISVVSHIAECERGADGLTTIDNSNRGMQIRIDAIAASFPPDSPQRLISISLLECLFVAQLERPYIHAGAYQALRTAVTNLMRIDPGDDTRGPHHHSDEWRAYWAREGLAQADIVRDVFGNPLRAVSLDPAWLSSDVLALARDIYEERAFDRMPILADAFQDAGCANDDILAHCRTETSHVRGCWVVDLVLGKK